MATPLFELLIDLSLAGLLVATMFFCWVLNQRIRVLQDGKSELARVLKHFDESTKRASESINTLQATGKRAGEVIKTRMERALQLSDDLYFLIEKAEKVADRLEAGISINRSTRRVQEELRSGSDLSADPLRQRSAEAMEPSQQGVSAARALAKAEAASSVRKPALSPSSEDESVLRAALQAARSESEHEMASGNTPQKPASPLHAMIEKIASRTASDPVLRGQRAAKFPESRARSRVEQELLEIIRADKG